MQDDQKILYEILYKLNLIIAHFGIDGNFVKYEGRYFLVRFPFDGWSRFDGSYGECLYRCMKNPGLEIVTELEFMRLREQFVLDHPELYRKELPD